MTNETNLPGIYKLVNQLNGRVYIGSATNLLDRKRQHFWYLNSNTHQNKFLQNDYNKCGKKYFKFKVLEYVRCKSNLNKIEQKYLNKFFDNTTMCYNICPVAYSKIGTKHSFEAKKKMSLAWSNKRKEKLIKQSKKLGLYSMFGEKNPFFGKNHTEETKGKIAKANKGRKLTKAQINKMKLTFFKKYGGAPNKGKTKTEIEKYKDMLAQKTRKKIIAINVISGEKETFHSVREASKILGLPARHHINLILENPHRKNGQYRKYNNWRFENVKQ